LRASTNNRASTVLEVFLDAVAEYGLPDRMRGDRGKENKDVSNFMILAKGPNRASFMWGRYEELGRNLIQVNFFSVQLITPVSSASGSRLAHISPANGVLFFFDWNACTNSIARTLATYGYFITYFSIQSTMTANNFRKNGTLIPSLG
jgi:hypothetical protein